MAKTERPLRENVAFYADFYRKYVWRVFWALLFHIIDIIPFALVPVLFKIIVDRYVPAGDKVSIIVMIFVALGFSLINTMFHAAYWVNYIGVVKSVSRDLRHMIVARLQMLSLSYHNQSETGRYFSKIVSDVERTEQFAHVAANNLFSGAFYLCFLCGVLGYINYRVLLIFFLVTPVYYILIGLFRRAAQRSRHHERLARENLSARVSSFLQCSLLARLHGHEDFEQRKVDIGSDEVTEKSTAAEGTVALFNALTTGVSTSFNYTVLAVTSFCVIDGTLTIGEMFLFASYTGMLMNQINALLGVWPIITLFNESVSSLQEILAAPDLEYNHGKRALAKVNGDVKLENVTFSYNPGQPVLKDVNVHIEPGMTVGLVGKSGSGKSTFVNLILGLFRTQNGLVMIDDVPVNELDMRTVRKFVGVVSQSPILFTGTIFENIVHAYQSTPLEKVVAAAKKANAHDFIVEMKNGYDSPAGENGVMLSGGQRQRIALARTLLREPSILVLDEATSALDSESERAVQRAIDNLVKSRQMTTFVIAHRLSTVRHVDLLLIFRDGQIVERGSHEELVALNGEYANLLAYQSLEDAPPAERPVPAPRRPSSRIFREK